MSRGIVGRFETWYPCMTGDIANGVGHHPEKRLYPDMNSMMGLQLDAPTQQRFPRPAHRAIMPLTAE
jgi:hypothetical protein